MIRIRTASDLPPAVHGRAARNGATVTVWLAPGLSRDQRAAVLRRLCREGRRNIGPALPAGQLHLAVAWHQAVTRWDMAMAALRGSAVAGSAAALLVLVIVGAAGAWMLMSGQHGQLPPAATGTPSATAAPAGTPPAARTPGYPPRTAPPSSPGISARLTVFPSRWPGRTQTAVAPSSVPSAGGSSSAALPAVTPPGPTSTLTSTDSPSPSPTAGRQMQHCLQVPVLGCI